MDEENIMDVEYQPMENLPRDLVDMLIEYLGPGEIRDVEVPSVDMFPIETMAEVEISSTPAVEPYLALEPSVEPSSALEPSVGPYLALEPSVEPSSALEPSVGPYLALEPSVGPFLAAEPSVGPYPAEKPMPAVEHFLAAAGDGGNVPKQVAETDLTPKATDVAAKLVAAKPKVLSDVVNKIRDNISRRNGQRKIEVISNHPVLPKKTGRPKPLQKPTKSEAGSLTSLGDGRTQVKSGQENGVGKEGAVRGTAGSTNTPVWQKGQELASTAACHHQGFSSRYIIRNEHLLPPGDAYQAARESLLDHDYAQLGPRRVDVYDGEDEEDGWPPPTRLSQSPVLLSQTSSGAASQYSSGPSSRAASRTISRAASQSSSRAASPANFGPFSASLPPSHGIQPALVPVVQARLVALKQNGSVGVSLLSGRAVSLVSSGGGLSQQPSSRAVSLVSSGGGLNQQPTGRAVSLVSSGGGLNQQPTGRAVSLVSSGGGLNQQPTGRAVSVVSSGGLNQQPTGRAVNLVSSGGGLNQQPTGRAVSLVSSGGGLNQQPTGRAVSLVSSGGGLNQQPTGRAVSMVSSGGLNQQPSSRAVNLVSSGGLNQQPTGRAVSLVSSGGGLNQQPTSRAVSMVSSGGLNQQPSSRAVSVVSSGGLNQQPSSRAVILVSSVAGNPASSGEATERKRRAESQAENCQSSVAATSPQQGSVLPESPQILNVDTGKLNVSLCHAQQPVSNRGLCTTPSPNHSRGNSAPPTPTGIPANKLDSFRKQCEKVVLLKNIQSLTEVIEARKAGLLTEARKEECFAVVPDMSQSLTPPMPPPSLEASPAATVSTPPLGDSPGFLSKWQAMEEEEVSRLSHFSMVHAPQREERRTPVVHHPSSVYSGPPPPQGNTAQQQNPPPSLPERRKRSRKSANGSSQPPQGVAEGRCITKLPNYIEVFNLSIPRESGRKELRAEDIEAGHVYDMLPLDVAASGPAMHHAGFTKIPNYATDPVNSTMFDVSMPPHSLPSTTCSSSGSRSTSGSRSPPSRRSRYRSRSRSRSRSNERSSYRSRSQRDRSRSRTRQDRRPRGHRQDDSDDNSSSLSKKGNNRREQRLKQKQMSMRERRTMYVGGISETCTRRDLFALFEEYGGIEDVQVYLREDQDNYGFVTFRSTEDTDRAIELGNKNRKMPYQLSYGGRREFCDSRYTDLDGNKACEEEYSTQPLRVDSYDDLLRKCQQRARRN
ncbi:hypothetical protein ACOMHN_054116 [Nucella lapillus]